MKYYIEIIIDYSKKVMGQGEKIYCFAFIVILMYIFIC